MIRINVLNGYKENLMEYASGRRLYMAILAEIR